MIFAKEDAPMVVQQIVYFNIFPLSYFLENVEKYVPNPFDRMKLPIDFLNQKEEQGEKVYVEAIQYVLKKETKFVFTNSSMSDILKGYYLKISLNPDYYHILKIIDKTNIIFDTMAAISNDSDVIIPKMRIIGNGFAEISL